MASGPFLIPTIYWRTYICVNAPFEPLLSERVRRSLLLKFNQNIKCGNGIVPKGTGEDEEFWTMAAAGNGYFVLAGNTYGNRSGTNAGDSDFVAVKLDASGSEVWRWQVSHAVYPARQGRIEVAPIILLTAPTIYFVQLSVMKTCNERYSSLCPSGINTIMYLVQIWSGQCGCSD